MGEAKTDKPKKKKKKVKAINMNNSERVKSSRR